MKRSSPSISDGLMLKKKADNIIPDRLPFGIIHLSDNENRPMNKKVKLVLLFVLLVLEAFLEIHVREVMTLKNIIRHSEASSQTLSQSMKRGASPKSVCAFLFKKYNDLHYVGIFENEKLIFYGNKSSWLKKYFYVAGTSLQPAKDYAQTDKRIEKHSLRQNLDILMVNSKLKDKNIVTGFLASYYPGSLVYFRNSIFFLIALTVYLYYMRKGKRMALNLKDNEKAHIRYTEIPQIMNYKELYEDNKKKGEELDNLTTFREVGLAINSILDFSSMLHVIMGVVMGKMNVRKICIYLIDEKAKELRGKIGRQDNTIIKEDELKSEKIIIGMGTIGRAMEDHSPLTFIDPEGSHILICPLVAKGHLIGALKVEEKKDNDLFNGQDKEFLRLLSAQISIALNNARLYEMAITDGLTGLYVHRHFQYKIQDEILRSKRNGEPLSLIMLDVDHFKNFNDKYGHQTGDFVLVELSSIVKKMFRVTDSSFRYGGEEVAVILPGADAEDAYTLAEKLREKTQMHKFQFNGQELNVTISLGVATFYPQGMKDISKENLIRMADDSLYYSKNHGRNRTSLFSENMLHSQYNEINVPQSPLKQTPESLEINP
ncbi:MAG: sensor domain-containing diguanylate cyclase [Spirochaetes bacterium]|nr:sensor domain-containing diguanylate cyclase [Spirochaetota bacterium]